MSPAWNHGGVAPHDLRSRDRTKYAVRVRTLLVYQHGTLRPDADPAEISELCDDPRTLLWLDLERPEPEDFGLLAEEFRFHPLALEDARKRNQRPKLDRYDGYDYVVLYDARWNARGKRKVHLTEVDVFLGRNYVVTLHQERVAAIAEVRDRWLKTPRMVEPHPLGFLLYHLADGIVDDYFPVLDALGERIEHVEEELFGMRGRRVLREIFALRHDLLLLRRIIAPTRDVFNVLSRRDQTIFHESTQVYFTDVYDHLLRMTDTLDTYRDLLAGALDAYLSIQSNDLNQVMRTLTAATITLMVPTLIAGIYGMNFVLVPPQDWPGSFALAVALMILAGAGSAAYFRGRGWL